jgi:simple sugar transport system permease protein
MAVITKPDVGARYRRAGLAARIRKHPAGPVGILLVTILLFSIAYALAKPDSFFFLSQSNASLVLRSIPHIGIVALGVGMLMIAGEFDLSVGSVYVATSFAMAYAFYAGVPMLLAIGLAYLISAGIGLLNAGITLRFGIPSFITTLGMMFIVRSAALYIAGLKTTLIVNLPQTFRDDLNGQAFGLIPAQLLWFLGLAGVSYLFLNRHFLGNHFFAAGGDRQAARFAGINVVWTKTLAFILSSAFATTSGILQVARGNQATAKPVPFIELSAVVVCVMGGVSLYGGRGAIIGIVLGAAVLQFGQDFIILARLPGFYLDMFFGIMIVLGVVMNTAVSKR